MQKYYLSTDKLDILFEEMIDCANFAKQIQKKIIREYKKDGSVLTKADIEISNRIINKINILFKDCNVVSEETITPFNTSAPYTFVLDPIDGTDVYSQGLPSFAIALGILDNNRKPVGAMIIAPRFGIAQEELQIRLDPDKDLLIDNEIFSYKKEYKEISQLAISSKLQKSLAFSKYSGKVRTFGSSILHILSPVIFSNIDGCINQRAFAWDIIASHAVLEKLNLKLLYSDKTPLIYDDNLLVERKVCKDIIYCGSEKCINKMIQTLPQITTD